MKISRRFFTKILSFCAFAFAFLRSRNLFGNASESCDITKYKNAMYWGNDHEILIWSDGFLDQSKNLAILLKYNKISTDVDVYMEKILLTNDSDELISAFYYRKEDMVHRSNVPGVVFSPYIIFNNIDVSSSNYYLYIQVRHTETIVDKYTETIVDKYKFVLTDKYLKNSLLDGDFLPPQLNTDLKMKRYGFFSTLFQFDKQIDYQSHTVECVFTNINSSNEFTLRVYFMHLDVDVTHFNEHFIVTDPVGRILGYVKRAYKDSQTAFVDVSALTEDQINSSQMTYDNVGKINECPYIMVFISCKKTISKSYVLLK